MRGLALLLGFLLWAGAAPAQTVEVRAGEHGSFTRLVLQDAGGTGWSLVAAPGGFDLRGPGEARFDVARTFDRIPRDRIAAATPRDGGRLALSVTCNCHARSFRAPGVGFVVDVVDGPAPPGALSPGRSTPVLPLQGEVPVLALPALVPPAVPLLFRPSGQVAPAVRTEEAERILRTEGEILEGLAEAASRGLLDLAPGAEVVLQGTVPQASGVDLTEAGRPGLAFRTGAATQKPAALASGGATCLAEEDFDIAAWVGSGDFGAEIAARTADLTDGRDRLQPEAAEALARAYLAFGFGREAAVALKVDGRSSRGRDILHALARLIDGEPAPSGAFQDQGGCLGPVTLWRALARGTIQGTDERERIAMSLSLRALPEAARDAVALRLANLFLDAGDAAGARTIAAQGDPTGTEALIAQADIAKETEGPATALAELTALARSDSRITPKAMADLLDLSVAEGRPVEEDLLELARALRAEQEGEPARALLLAEARALTAAGRYDEALDLFDRERALHHGEDIDAALTATAEALTQGLEDAPFLELALSGLPADLPPTARESLAGRLSALGFPDEAWALRAPALSDTPATPTGRPVAGIDAAPPPERLPSSPPMKPEAAPDLAAPVQPETPSPAPAEETAARDPGERATVALASANGEPGPTAEEAVPVRARPSPVVPVEARRAEATSGSREAAAKEEIAGVDQASEPAGRLRDPAEPQAFPSSAGGTSLGPIRPLVPSAGTEVNAASAALPESPADEPAVTDGPSAPALPAAPSPAVVAAAPPSGMTLAERRALLTQAEAARARAQALLSAATE